MKPLTSFLMMSLLTTVKSEIYKGQHYTKELLLKWYTKGNQPCNLNVHKKSNTLFFCFNKPASFSTSLASYNLDTNKAQSIMGLKKGCAIAIDQDNGVVYLGSLSGIYIYNMESQHPEYFAEKGVHIKSLFYHDRLYYIRGDRKLFMEFEGQFVHVFEFIDLAIDRFHISREGVVFFADKGDIYVYDQNQSQWKLKGLREINAVNEIGEDNQGTIYVCTDRGVYTVLYNGLEKFMPERDILGITADRNNNLIVANSLSIYKLQKSEPA